MGRSSACSVVLQLPLVSTATRRVSVPSLSSTEPLASAVPLMVTPAAFSGAVMMLSPATDATSALAGGVSSKCSVVSGRVLCTPLLEPTTSRLLVSDRPVAGSVPLLGVAVFRSTAQLPFSSALVV